MRQVQLKAHLSQQPNGKHMYVLLSSCFDWDGEIRFTYEADLVMGGNGGRVERFLLAMEGGRVERSSSCLRAQNYTCSCICNFVENNVPGVWKPSCEKVCKDGAFIVHNRTYLGSNERLSR